jgi:hypothetical protein
MAEHDDGRPAGNRAADKANEGVEVTLAHWSSSCPVSVDVASAMSAWRRLVEAGLSCELSWHALFGPFGLCECAWCGWRKDGAA